jgi:hypothetical protein
MTVWYPVGKSSAVERQLFVRYWRNGSRDSSSGVIFCPFACHRKEIRFSLLPSLFNTPLYPRIPPLLSLFRLISVSTFLPHGINAGFFSCLLLCLTFPLTFSCWRFPLLFFASCCHVLAPSAHALHSIPLLLQSVSRQGQVTYYVWVLERDAWSTRHVGKSGTTTNTWFALYLKIICNFDISDCYRGECRD